MPPFILLFFMPLFVWKSPLFGLERGGGAWGLGEECHVFARVLNLAPAFVRSPLAASTSWSSPHALLRLGFVLLVGLALEIERRLLFKCQQRGAGRENCPEKCTGADSWQREEIRIACRMPPSSGHLFSC